MKSNKKRPINYVNECLSCGARIVDGEDPIEAMHNHWCKVPNAKKLEATQLKHDPTTWYQTRGPIADGPQPVNAQPANPVPMGVQQFENGAIPVPPVPPTPTYELWIANQLREADIAVNYEGQSEHFPGVGPVMDELLDFVEEEIEGGLEGGNDPNAG